MAITGAEPLVLLDAWVKDRDRFVTALGGLAKSQRSVIEARLMRDLAAQQLPEGMEDRLRLLWPETFIEPLAPAHTQFLDAVKAKSDVVFIAPRSFAKSSLLETLPALAGIDGSAYVLLVSGTQEIANRHLADIEARLLAPNVAVRFPGLASRGISKFGTAQGWRRNRLVTADGVTIDALGLDVKARGLKMGNLRPTHVFVDDVDEADDSSEVSQSKWDRLTLSILPTMAAIGAQVIFVQNMVGPHGVASRLLAGEALVDAVRIGPIPALVAATYDEDGFPNGGTPSWDAQPVEVQRALARTWGAEAWRRESQHEVTKKRGVLWVGSMFTHDPVPPSLPEFGQILIGVDPSGGKGRGDNAGIVVVGQIGRRFWVLADLSGLLPREEFGAAVSRAYATWGGVIVHETTGAGEHAASTMQIAGVPLSRMVGVAAVGSKADRARPVAELYSAGRVAHVAGLGSLEASQTSWVPGSSRVSPGDIDALVHAISYAMNQAGPSQSLTAHLRTRR